MTRKTTNKFSAEVRSRVGYRPPDPETIVPMDQRPVMH